MTTFSIESSIFAKLKTTVGINSIALQRLIDAANQNPELNLMLTKAESFNDVVIRIAENNELVNLGAGAVFDYFTQGQINDNRMAIIIDPSWVIGPSATLNTTSLATRASVLNVFGHEFDHYMRVETFREIDKLQDLSYRPELTAEQRFELYATQRMQAEVQGWYTGLRTFRAELTAGNTAGDISALDRRRLTSVEQLLLDVEAQGRKSGLSGAELETFIAENGAAVLSRNSGYWNTYVDAMSNVNGINADAVRQRLAYRLNQPDDVLEWSAQGVEGAPQILTISYRNGQRVEETQNPDLTGQSSRFDANNQLLERSTVLLNADGSRSYRNYSGFSLTDIDPLTGVQTNTEVRYDLSGRPYGAEPGSEVGASRLPNASSAWPWSAAPSPRCGKRRPRPSRPATATRRPA